MSRKSPGRRRATRSNPKPRAWSTKGPSRAYECKSPLLGRTVRLGRSEVVVESCATPSRAKPGQGQFRVRAKATGKSRAVARRRVSAAIYRAKHPRNMPPGLLTFWAKTRSGGVAPASSLRRAPEKEIPPFVYDPHGPLPSAQFGPGIADVLRQDFRHRALPSAQFGPTAPEPGRRAGRHAKPKTETFARARARILDEFKALHWDVHTRNTARGGGPLKVPYVTSHDGRRRIDFHEQSAYSDGHSIESDLRGVSAASLVERLARPNPSGARWRPNHHGGWHAPGDPLGYAARANRSRVGRRRRSR